MRRRIPGVTARSPLLHIIRAVATPVGAMFALAACAEQLVIPPQSVHGNTSALAKLTCLADVRAATVACSPASERSPGGRAPNYSLVLGGQGTYIQLTATNSSYSAGTQIFSADIAVQNLTALQLGTTDGITVSGVTAFISDGPAVTSGTGSISVNNADGTATFTASNQPFFLYNEILEVFSGKSSAKTWMFNVPSTVTTFTFSVLIQTSAPMESGVLRWTAERGYPVFTNAVWAADAQNVFACGTGVCYRSTPTGWLAMNGLVLTDSIGFSNSVLGMGGSSATDVWAVGGGGSIAHYDGVKWRSTATPTFGQLNGVWATSPTDVWAVGLTTPKIIHYDGANWSTSFTLPANQGLWSVHALSATDVWAAGGSLFLHYTGGVWSTIPIPNGLILRGMWPIADNDVWLGTTAFNGQSSIYHYDGNTVTAVPNPATGSIHAIWGVSAHDIWAADGLGLVMHYDGSSWTTVTTIEQTAQTVPEFSGTSSTDLWLAQWGGGPPYHYDGVSGSRNGGNMNSLTGLASNVVRMWASSGTNAYAIGSTPSGGTILHNSGSGWAIEVNGGVPLPRSIFGTSASDVWVVGDNGSILHSSGGSWSAVPSGTSTRLQSVWASSSSDAWAVGDAGTIVHYTGGAWIPVASGTPNQLIAVFGSSSSDVWAVGVTGTLLHWDGNAWSSSPGGASNMTLTGGWAGSNADAWIVGSQSFLVNGVTQGGFRLILHWNGTQWTQTGVGNAPGGVNCVHGSATNDVWVGGPPGGLFHWNGSAWSIVPTGLSAGVCPFSLSPTDVYAVGSGVILHGTR